MPNNQPAARFRVGLVTATVWENESGDSKFFTTVLSRSYKDGDNKWQQTDNLNQGDLLNGAKVLQRAEQFISEQA